MKRGSTVALISRTHLETEPVVYSFYADTLKVRAAPWISFTVKPRRPPQAPFISFKEQLLHHIMMKLKHILVKKCL